MSDAARRANHEPIGHWDGEHEPCPLCRALADRDRWRAAMARLECECGAEIDECDHNCICVKSKYPCPPCQARREKMEAEK